jgi:hypothetical protein
MKSAPIRNGQGHWPGSPNRVADQSKALEERADGPEWIMAGYKYYYLNEKNEILHQIRARSPHTRARGARKKKARYRSGLNLSLEENRGDMSMMLHRKIEIQFIFAMTVINSLNSTAETA